VILQKGVKLSSTRLMNSCLHIVQGCTPLHHAAWHGQLAVLKTLLSSGAHVNTQNHKVSLMSQLCRLSGHVPSSSACWANEVNIGSISLCNCALQGQTALHWAARRGYATVVKELIAAGADVNATDNQVNILTVPLLSLPHSA